MTATIHALPGARLPVEPTSNDAGEMDWLNADDLTVLGRIAPQKAKSALRRGHAGKAWRGVTLRVELQAGGLAVYAPSLPEDLFQRWLQQQPERQSAAPVEAPPLSLAQEPASAPDIDVASEARKQGALWRLGLIRPALAHPRRSKARAAAVAAVAGQLHLLPDGREKRIGKSTLRDWIGRYEAGGLAALADKPREDRNQRRVRITREWDRAMTGLLSAEAVAHIERELTRYIRSTWRSGIAGWREAADRTATKLVELTRAAGSTLPEPALADLCCVDRATGMRRLVEAYAEYALVDKADRDAKAFFDTNLPRIRRQREGMRPMDLVVGDVTPLDIYIDRPEDGAQCTIKAISWLDMATNRLWVSLYLPPKGKGVTRLQVAASFASMCQQWGLPKKLYLDNGSEYSWAEMLGGFAELSRLSQSAAVHLLSDTQSAERELVTGVRDEIIRARAYNAPAKPIEGLFSVLNVVLSMLPGYIGGNRMSKKTHNIGKAPVSFPGTPRDFLEAFTVALNHYHNKPQAGTLGDRSPRQVYQDQIDAGWTRSHCPAETLLLAFADEDVRTVRQGYITWTPAPGQTLYYTHDRLIRLADSQRKVRVRVARHDPRFAFIFPHKGYGLLCVATPDTAYAPTDTAGAKEQSRRAGLLKRWVAELRQDCDLLDMVAEMKRSDSHKPAMPTAPIGAEVTLTPEIAAMRAGVEDAARTALEEAGRRADPARLSQWADAHEDDPYLDAVSGWGE